MRFTGLRIPGFGGGAPMDLRSRLVRAGASVIAPTTDSGWATYGSGGRLFLPAATNLCATPNFALDTDSNGLSDGWSNKGSEVGDPTYTRVAGRAGGYAQRLQYVASGGNVGKVTQLACALSNAGTVTAGDVVTLSVYVRGSLSGVQFKLAVDWYADDAYLSTPQSATAFESLITSDWTRISFTFSAAPATANRVDAAFRFNAVDDGDQIDITLSDVLLEKSPFATPYFDGSMPNCAWTGAANASASTRARSQLKFPDPFGGANQTYAVRLSPQIPSNAGKFLFVAGTAANDKTTFLFLGTDGKWGFETYDAHSHDVFSAVQSFAAGSVHHLVGRRGATTLDLNANGVDSAQVAHDAVFATNPLGIVTCNWTYLNEQPSIVGPVLVSPTRKPDAWVTAIQANSGAAYNDPVRLWNEFMEPGDLLIPLQSDAKAYLKP